MKETYNTLTIGSQLTVPNYRNTARGNNTVEYHKAKIEYSRQFNFGCFFSKMHQIIALYCNKVLQSQTQCDDLKDNDTNAVYFEMKIKGMVAGV